MTPVATACRPVFGTLGLICGTVALMMVLLHFTAGPLAPKHNTGFNIGEVAAEIKQAARRKFSGQPAPPLKAAPWDADRFVKAAAMALATLAVGLSAAGLLRQETPYRAIAAIALGIGVFLVQVAVWLGLLSAGLVVMVAIIRNLDVLSGD